MWSASNLLLTWTQIVSIHSINLPIGLHSTETTLTAVFSVLIQEMNAGNITLLLLLDLSAAVDCVDHEILLNRLLITYGLESTVINWFTSYLSDRTQRSLLSKVNYAVRCSARVRIRATYIPTLYSKHRRINSASWTVVISLCWWHTDVHLLPPGQHTSASWYHTVVYLQHRGVDMLKPTKIKSAKTEFLWCTTHRRLHLVDENLFIIENATIQPAMYVRNHGVLMDRYLSLRSQIARLTGACFRASRQARAIRHSLTTDALRMLISSAVLSRIDYCNCIFAGLPDFNLDHLQ